MFHMILLNLTVIVCLLWVLTLSIGKMLSKTCDGLLFHGSGKIAKMLLKIYTFLLESSFWISATLIVLIMIRVFVKLFEYLYY